MSALRKIYLQGGPDSTDIQVFDSATGALIKHVVKIELTITPEGGALAHITTVHAVDGFALLASGEVEELPGAAFRLISDDEREEAIAAGGVDPASVGFYASPLGVPIEEPAASVNDITIPGAAAYTAEPDPAGSEFRLHPADAPVAEELLPGLNAAIAAAPVTLCRPQRLRKPRVAKPKVEEPGLIEQMPKPAEGVRRAPPPEDISEADKEFLRTVLAPPEPDLSAEDKDELTMLLASANTTAPEPRATLPPGTPWPFDTKPRLFERKPDA